MLPQLDLDAFDLDAIPDALLILPEFLPHAVLPLLRRGQRLLVAVARAEDLDAIPTRDLGETVQGVLVTPEQLTAALESLAASGRRDRPQLDSRIDNLDVEVTALPVEPEEADAISDAGAHEDQAPVVRFVNQVLTDAVNKSVSDIHFEPYESSYRIRFRADGVLFEAARPPRQLGRRLAARLKVLAQLDITERRLPQDGRFKLRIAQAPALDLRINSLPTLWGEKLVLRLLNSKEANLKIDKLGFEPAQAALFEAALDQPDGMILVTGPTGSGKTLTLYSGLHRLNTPERNVATAEDPVEINLEGVNQVNINPRVGLTFATALRAFLRQDPDVLMVGEIRDPETAEIAVKAAQTGHLVLSTLHTNSAAETLDRLRNIGVEDFNLASSVRLIVAQRLLRRLCPHCRRGHKVSARTLAIEGFSAQQAANLSLYEADRAGCHRCRGGYLGRTGVYEVMQITPELGRMILDGEDSSRLAELAHKQGYHGLRTACLNKVASGVTSLMEANRVSRRPRVSPE